MSSHFNCVLVIGADVEEARYRALRSHLSRSRVLLCILVRTRQHFHLFSLHKVEDQQLVERQDEDFPAGQRPNLDYGRLAGGWLCNSH